MSRAVRKHPSQQASVGASVDETAEVARVRAALLDWYDVNARDLPWRVRPGRAGLLRADPYRVWLSEIMLQQTTVAAVTPYFLRFLDRFPTIEALANAPRDDVLTAWAGLGYYSRARNMHAAAQILAERGFPQDEAGWRALPGVGAYTAAAVAAIAFGAATNVVDGNVERVLARLHAVDTPLPSAKPMLRELASHYIRADGAEDWPQALMDLGSGVCTPRAPRCGVCPIAFACKGLAAGDPARLPTKAPKAEKPQRFGVAFALVSNGAVLVERRPDEGLLGGMRALPTTPWRASMWSPEEAMAHAPTATDWRRVGAVRHVFTHFALALEVYAATGSPGAGETAALDALQSAGLPTLFRKAAALVSF